MRCRSKLASLSERGGSGLDALQQLDLQNHYNRRLLSRSSPWYADKAIDATNQLRDIHGDARVSMVDSNFATSGTETNLLISLSNSGCGALDLLFKHPSAFAAAATWDFPADMAAYDNYGARVLGTNADLQGNYRMTSTFIDNWKAPFTTEDRIWIFGYDAFQTDVAEFDALLTSHGVLHTFLAQTYDAHNWNGGWPSDAVSGLV